MGEKLYVVNITLLFCIDFSGGISCPDVRSTSVGQIYYAEALRCHNHSTSPERLSSSSVLLLRRPSSFSTATSEHARLEELRRGKIYG